MRTPESPSSGRSISPVGTSEPKAQQTLEIQEDADCLDLQLATKSSSCLPRLAVGAKRLTDLSRGTRLDGAQSKDLEHAHLSPAAPSFSTADVRISNSPQKRHPACPGLPWERSASQIYRVTQRLWARSRRTSRMLILPICSELFNRRSPHPGGSRYGLSPGTENKNRCILLCSVGYLYVASLASVVEKVRGAWVR